LSKKGYPVVLTARDCAQTCGLADRNGFRYKRIGRHFGKQKLFKIFGLFLRVLQLAPFALREKPVLALSHGSRSQVVVAYLLGIPSVMVFDYEHTQLVKPTWVILPEIVPSSSIKFDQRRIFKYPGIKEDVYVPTCSPDPAILGELGLDEKQTIITIRPPATEAHYHNAQSEVLFYSSIERFGQMEDVRMILLPRSKSQKEEIQNKWPELISKKKIIIPERVVDGLNLIWHSDLVISGGGTMNREAAALEVPVYSIFRGEIGAVDIYLIGKGKLILLETVDDIKNKVHVVKRELPSRLAGANCNKTLESIVHTITALMESNHR
jgi:uncharacterized protein